MRGYWVIVSDMLIIGKSINLVVDTDIDVEVKIRVGNRIEKCTRKLDCIILEYVGGYDFDTLKKMLKTGQKVFIGITRDFKSCTTQEEIRFCA